MKNIQIIFLVAAGSFLLTANAFAHRVNVFAWVQGDTVHVESKFRGGKKVKEGKIIVTDSAGVELLAGKTNNQGEFSFKLPQRTEIKIILEAGMGHRAEWTIPVDDIESIAPVDNTLPEKIIAKKESINTQAMPQEQHASMPLQVPAETSLAAIEVIVEKALDKKLKPVFKMLSESREKGPTVGDILGGIGYIIGLMGIAAYFRYHKRKVGGQ